ncbi:MAG: GAF domain-containing protein [Deltaproteobacteria bacterium]|nr:GAF domain-containing protein [Deltaproteobacteria bacterium]
MTWFEVFIPAKAAGLPSVTLTVEAPNWIGALRTGLSNLGEGQEAIANVMCDIKEDNSIHVTDVASARVFRLREVTGPASRRTAPAPVPMPVIPDAPAAPPPLPPAPPPAPLPPPVQAAPPAPLPPLPAAPLPPPAPLPLPLPAAPLPPPAPLPLPLPAAPLPPPAPLPQPPPPAPLPPSVPAAPPAAPLPPTVQAAPPPAPPPTPLPPAAPAPQQPLTHAAPMPPLPPREATTVPPPAQPTNHDDPTGLATRQVPPPQPHEATAIPPPAATAPVSAPTRGVPAPPPLRPTGQFDAAPQPVSREVSTAPQPAADIGRHKQPVSPQLIADAVADVFDATQDLLLEGIASPSTIGERLLDIALQYIPAESASFYVADVNHDELRFAAVRGPRAEEIMTSGLAVKVGEGVVGFCAREGVCLVVNDLQKDPRWGSSVAHAIGHSPRDTICASAEKEGRLYGAVQVLNSKQGFTAVHMEVLRYVGLTAATLLERHENAR